MTSSASKKKEKEAEEEEEEEEEAQPIVALKHIFKRWIHNFSFQRAGVWNGPACVMLAISMVAECSQERCRISEMLIMLIRDWNKILRRP